MQYLGQTKKLNVVGALALFLCPTADTHLAQAALPCNPTATLQPTDLGLTAHSEALANMQASVGDK